MAVTHLRGVFSEGTPIGQTGLVAVTSTAKPKRARKPQPVEVGRVLVWNPHVAGALALAMRQGQTIRATYAAGTITLTTENGK